MATELTAQAFDAEVINANLPVVIDFYAPWCGPCRIMTPLFEKVSKENEAKYKFFKVNVDEQRELAIKFGISSIPAFVFFKAGKQTGTERGVLSEFVLLEKIKKYCD